MPFPPQIVAQRSPSLAAAVNTVSPGSGSNRIPDGCTVTLIAAQSTGR